VFRGRAVLDDEPDILREVVAAARARYRMPSGQELARDLGSSLLKRPLDLGISRQSPEGLQAETVDAATPYRLKDAFAVIDEMIGLHEQRWPRHALRSLKVRLESLHADPRYRFMFGRANMYETVAPILAQVFRIPMHGRPITAFQLGGLPGEVVNAVASVLSRLAFDLASASQGACEILVLCEEAHRYVPSDTSLGFAPTRQALARIAKEGRKYAAPGRARPDHPVAMLHRLRDAVGQRARPADHPLGDLRRLRQHDQLPILHRQSRGDRLRRGRRHDDADALR
jgi:DNA helicase HerA-like ATPase